MLFIDTHVHIYDCFDINEFFDCGYANFSRAAADYGVEPSQSIFFMLLAESRGNRWFTEREIKKQKSSTSFPPYWQVDPLADNLSMVAHSGSKKQKTITVVAGRQIVTMERLEVLALFCPDEIPEGLSIKDTVDRIDALGGVAVVPWGAGKWLGSRGKILTDYLRERDVSKSLFLGDNGGRPPFWKEPCIFKEVVQKGRQILPGSDPLPLSHEARRVASYGISIDCELDGNGTPAEQLRSVFRSREMVAQQFGSRVSNTQFVINQLQLRISGKR